MGLAKTLRKAILEENSLRKGEDTEAYRKLASTGFMLGHPVKINGKDKRPDNNIAYHSTIKFFDKEGDNTDEAHRAASKLHMPKPDPKKVHIEPKVLKDRNGNDVYAIGLHGYHADKMKENHHKLSHMGHKENYEWGAHISVDKATHDRIKAAGHKTAHEAGIEFGHAELKRGPKVLQTYHSEDIKKTEDIEDIETSSKLDLKKGKKDILEKSLSEIQKDTAWTWAARAAASYEKLAETGDWKWKTDAEEYRHEAVEHAALIGDTHPYVLEEIHKSLEKYRIVAQKDAESLEKIEPLIKPWSSQAQAAWGHSPEGRAALGGEAAVKEWDRATKGKHLPKHVKKTEDLEKGALKNMLTAGALAGVIASNTPAEPTKATPPLIPSRAPASVQPHSEYSRDKILNTIAQVESSGGKNTQHKPTSHGTAYGKWAVMPDTIRETIKMNPDLKRQHSKALNLQGDNLNHYMQDNPKLEQEIVNRHLDRLEHHFGKDPDKIAFAYNQGITGTNRALKQKHNIGIHPYVQKFRQYYGKGE